MTFGSSPAPLMSLPISSTMSRSMSSRGRPGRSPRATSWRASSPDSISGPSRSRTSQALCCWFSKMATPNRTGTSRRRATAASWTISPRSRATPALCSRSAPSWLPRPIHSIFMRPLPIGPAKSVCGFTRLTITMPSAPAASRSKHSGMSPTAPTGTTSMVARIGAPTASDVMPNPARTSVWPAAVAPPWEPIAGTMNGSQPAERSSPTMALTAGSRPSTPRLPTASGTVKT